MARTISMPSGPVLTLRELDILKKQMNPNDYSKILDQMVSNMTANVSGVVPNYNSYFDTTANFKSIFGNQFSFNTAKKKPDLFFYHAATPMSLTEVPDFAELIEIKKWFKMVEEGELEDTDGFGELAREGKSSDAEIILPSKAIAIRSFPKWATHIAWYATEENNH